VKQHEAGAISSQTLLAWQHAYQPSTLPIFQSHATRTTMGTESKAVLVCLRIWELICSVIVIGILAAFLDRVDDGDGPSDGRIIYALVTACVSTVFSLVFIVPFLHSFFAFPGDFILWIMWLVAFCLLDTVRTCHALPSCTQTDALPSAPASTHAAPRGSPTTGGSTGAGDGGGPSSSRCRAVPVAPSGEPRWPSASWPCLPSS